MLKCMFQFYLSQCYIASAQLPVSVCLYQHLSKPGSYRNATLEKHYFCWVPVQCPLMSQVLSLLFLTLHLHSKTTLQVHRSTRACLKHNQTSALDNAHKYLHYFIQLQSNPTTEQISVTGCHNNTHFLFQYMDNCHYHQLNYSLSQHLTLHS